MQRISEHRARNHVKHTKAWLEVKIVTSSRISAVNASTQSYPVPLMYSQNVEKPFMKKKQPAANDLAHEKAKELRNHLEG